MPEFFTVGAMNFYAALVTVNDGLQMKRGIQSDTQFAVKGRPRLTLKLWKNATEKFSFPIQFQFFTLRPAMIDAYSPAGIHRVRPPATITLIHSGPGSERGRDMCEKLRVMSTEVAGKPQDTLRRVHIRVIDRHNTRKSRLLSGTSTYYFPVSLIWLKASTVRRSQGFVKIGYIDLT
jgi:hypothetical protein